MIRDVVFIRSLLPRSYQVSEYSKGIHCSSHVGMDENAVEKWNKIFADIKQHFGDRFQEIYHIVNHDHKEFEIYFKTDPLIKELKPLFPSTTATEDYEKAVRNLADKEDKLEFPN